MNRMRIKNGMLEPNPSFKFFKIFFFTTFILTFISIVAYWVFVIWLATKAVGGIQDGSINTEKAGEQVGKFLKGIEQGKK